MGKASSGVLQGSALGAALFLIYINDLDHSIKTQLKKFADDKKLSRVKNAVQSLSLEYSHDNSLDLANDRQMFFNLRKYKVLHVGRGKPNFKYSMGALLLGEDTEERGSGVTVTESLKSSKQCNVTAYKASRV